jgi:ribose 5-phosphate isomerase A
VTEDAVNQDEQKKAVAAQAVRHVRDKMMLGLGTGSTSRHFIHLLAQRVQEERLSIAGVATSGATAELATQLGIEVRGIDEVQRIDLYVDGVDEISTGGAIIKGGGGALLREKIVAANSDQRVYIADNSKLVESIGGVPLPVEVIPFGHTFTGRRLQKLGAEAVLRTSASGPYLTDSKNFIYDCKFGRITDPAGLNDAIHRFPGVVETGLFLGLDGVVVTMINGSVVERRGPPFSWEP